MSFRDDADGATMGFKPGETFTQPKITGYRQLNEAEAALMNRIKDFGNADIAAGILAVVADHITAQRRAAQTALRKAESAATLDEAKAIGDPAKAELQRLDYAQSERWAAIARTHFQEGLMALTRAVAQPGSF